MTSLEAEIRQPPRLAPVAARLLGFAVRAASGLVAAVLTLALLLLLGAGALAWRLAEGPLPLGAVLHRAGIVPEGVAIGQVSLAWAGWRGGPGEPVEVRAAGVRAASLPGVASLRLDEGSVALASVPLLHGVIAPLAVHLAGLDAQLLPSSGGTAVSPSWFDIGALASLDARDVRVSSGAAWSAQASAATMREAADGSATGSLAGTVTAGGVSVPVQARIARAADGTLHVDAQSGQVRPAALAAAIPALAGLAALAAPVALTATADLSESLAPVRVSVQAAVGEGTAAVAGGRFQLGGASGEVTLSWTDEVLNEAALTRLAVTVRSPSGGAPTAIELAGSAKPQGGGWRVQGEVAFDQVAAADLPRLWPPDLSVHARRWVTENITGGVARAGRVGATMDVPADLGGAKIAAVSGGFQGEDLTIHWLRPVPPVEHVRATLEVVDPDTIRVTVLGGEQGAIRVKGGTILFTGLTVHDQVAAITLDLGGPLAAVVALLSHPRLKLLSKKPLPFTVAAGQLAGTLEVRLPLLSDLDADDVGIKTHDRLSGVALRNVVAGRSMTQGALDLDATNEGLRITGRAQLAGVPSRLAVEADFRQGPPSQVLLKVDVTGRVTAAALEREGLDAQGVLTGAGLLSVQYITRRDKQGEVTLRVKLGEAAVSTPIWQKPAGATATASAHLVLRDDRLVGVDELHAQGPGLLVQARAEMVGGRPAVLKLERVVLDRTEAAGEIRFPSACGGALCVRLAGPVLDLSGGLGRIAQSQSGGKKTGGTPWRATVRFGQVLLDKDRTLGPLRAEAASDGKRLVSAAVDAPGVQGSLREQGRTRVASLRVADAGDLLRAAGTTDLLHGGRLSLDGRFDDAVRGSPFTGTADLAGFSVQRAVVTGKVLQALTLYGIVDAIRGPGLFFSRAVVPLRYAGNVLELHEARAYSAALGVTAKGWLDFGHSTLGIQGTVVPAYVLNSLLGRLPVIGRLFSPERGGGLIAADVALRGKLDAPSVSFNPLSLLTPGALRDVFR